MSKWDLSTAWDVSTAKNENETGSGFWASQIGIASTAYNVGNNRGSSPYGLGFSTTGTRFWWLAGEGGSPGASNLFENETQRSYGLTSAYYNAKYDNYDMFPQVGRNQRVDNSDNRKRFHMRHMYPNTPEFVGFGSNGKIMYVLNSFDDDIHQYHLAAPYDMFNWTEQPMDIGFSTDGRQMYVLGQDTKKI